MGNYAYTHESRFMIPRARVAECAVDMELRLTQERVMPAIPDGTPEAERVRAMLASQGLQIALDPEGNLTDLRFMDGRKLGQTSAIDAAAPHVTAGSFVDFRQDYAEGPTGAPNTRWTFGATGLQWHSLVPAWWQRLKEESRRRRDAGLPELCEDCWTEDGGAVEMVATAERPPGMGPLAVLHRCPRCNAGVLGVPRGAPVSSTPDGATIWRSGQRGP